MKNLTLRIFPAYFSFLNQIVYGKLSRQISIRQDGIKYLLNRWAIKFDFLFHQQGNAYTRNGIMSDLRYQKE